MNRKKYGTEYSFLFISSLVMGIFLVTFFSQGKFPENTMMNEMLASDILTKGFCKTELFIRCCLKRISFFLILFLFSVTQFKRKFFRLMTISIGLSMGILIKLFYLWYGNMGILLLLIALFPHYFFYWMAYGLIYWNRWEYHYQRTKKIRKVISVFGVVITGCLMESYVNSYLMMNFLKLFQK